MVPGREQETNVKDGCFMHSYYTVVFVINIFLIKFLVFDTLSTWFGCGYFQCYFLMGFFKYLIWVRAGIKTEIHCEGSHEDRSINKLFKPSLCLAYQTNGNKLICTFLDDLSYLCKYKYPF